MSRFVDVVVPRRLGTSFRWQLASTWTTNLGDGVAVAAGPLLVAALTNDPFLVSLAALLRWAPPLVFGLHAGVLSDRIDRRRIIVVANALRVIVLSVLVVMMITDHLTVAVALIALGMLATAEVFADNSFATLTPMLVHRDDLALANSRVGAGFITLNQLAGPPLGAALFAIGMAWPFLGHAVLVFAGVVLVSRVVLPPRSKTSAESSRSVLRDIAEGFQWAVHHAAVRTLSLTILIFNVTFGAAWSVLVLYAQDRLGLGDIGFGLIATVCAVGGLLGTGLYGWITRRVSLGNVMRVGLIIETLTHLALAVTTSPWLASAVFFVFGAHVFVWGTTAITVRQRAVPEHLQGRVSSVNTVCVFGGLVVGSAVGGVLASRFGITAPFWFAFIGSAVFVVLLWRELTRIAHADDHPATHPEASAQYEGADRDERPKPVSR